MFGKIRYLQACSIQTVVIILENKVIKTVKSITNFQFKKKIYWEWTEFGYEYYSLLRRYTA
jgi:hypothetical protein